MLKFCSPLYYCKLYYHYYMKSIFSLIISILIGGIIAVGYFRFAVDKNPVLSPISQNTIDNFSIAHAPKESIIGNITAMTGDVFWESRVATQPAKIELPVSVKQGENLVTKDDGNATVVFAGIGSIELLPKTETDFVQTLPTNFVVDQKQGTADYTKNGTVPFSIRSLHLLTTISGKITLTIDEDELTVTITVKKGSATVAYNNLNYVSQLQRIEEGQKLVFDDNTRTVIVK